jgi:hypothetical protein
LTTMRHCERWSRTSPSNTSWTTGVSVVCDGASRVPTCFSADY